VLSEFPLSQGFDLALAIEEDGPRTGRALVECEDIHG